MHGHGPRGEPQGHGGRGLARPHLAFGGGRLTSRPFLGALWRGACPPSIASSITSWPITRSLAECSALPRTRISQCEISTPAEVEATREKRSQRLPMTSSPSDPGSVSPRAAATPSADAAREYPMEAYVLCVTTCRPRADASRMASAVRSGHLI